MNAGVTVAVEMIHIVVRSRILKIYERRKRNLQVETRGEVAAVEKAQRERYIKKLHVKHCRRDKMMTPREYHAASGKLDVDGPPQNCSRVSGDTVISETNPLLRMKIKGKLLRAIFQTMAVALEGHNGVGGLVQNLASMEYTTLGSAANPIMSSFEEWRQLENFLKVVEFQRRVLLQERPLPLLRKKALSSRYLRKAFKTMGTKSCSCMSNGSKCSSVHASENTTWGPCDKCRLVKAYGLALEGFKIVGELFSVVVQRMPSVKVASGMHNNARISYRSRLLFCRFDF
ncbi:hypothetical protein TIFTF001_019452 [Ficus carica]|uniref:Uncharacterized protein n=1 Tax=Ficus carica TaxID=3494 RepID=A0AA88AED0_FICCA|nr:hypothetical protein TIFTF001_019452 [Ficus carica]